MSYLFPNYARQSFEIMEGNGSHLTDDRGREFLDFTSGIGVVNLGHHNPQVEAALRKQADILWHTPNLYQNHLQEEVAELLGAKDDYVAYFCNSGAEANEAAIKLARKATQRTKIITFTQSFHGRTYGAMTATGQAVVHEGFAPLVPDFVYVDYNESVGLKEQLDENTAAVMLELIQGEGGVLPADPEWVKEVATLCQENGTLLIVDEVQTGIGRTGTFYVYEQYGLQPDILALAKGLGNGFPVGAMLGKRKLAASFGPGSHGTTYGGNKLAMVVAKEVIKQINDEKFLAAVQQKSVLAFEELAKIKSHKIKEIRGKGLMIGIVLQDEVSVSDVMEELEARGLLTLKAGGNVLRLLPPLTISENELKDGLAKIAQVLTD